MLVSCRPSPPAALAAIEEDSRAIGFTMASDLWTGALLRTLAASKPGADVLELGTGTGLSAAWLLDGMDTRSTLLSVDNDASVASIARRHLGHDPRVELAIGDGGERLRGLRAEGRTFDLVFADAWPGKYSHLEEALGLLKPGGVYVIDDMLPQPNWPDDHPAKVAGLIDALRTRSDLVLTAMNWSTGVLIAVRRG